jgi:CRISPR-associated protein (TIGR03986 family)
MIPNHSNPSSLNTSRIAHAPYNFVPLPEQVIRVDYKIPGHDRYAGRTGYMDCSLTTLTPTYTRAALNPEFFACWSDDKSGMMKNSQARETYAQFFHLDDAQRPIIPGSSLRGMTRALIEIAGYGKMQWVNEDNLIFRAVGDPSSLGDFYRSKFLGVNKASSPDMHFDYPSPQIRGGYLRITPNGYAILPASQHLGETFIHVEYEEVRKILSVRNHSFYDVYVAPDKRKTSDRGRRGSGILKLDLAIAPNISDKPKIGLVKAKLVTSGHMGGRHKKHCHCAIYEPDSSAKLIPIPERLWRLYSKDCEISRGITPRIIERDWDPLFYLVNDRNELVFFGPTVMFRVPYDTSPSDLVPSFIKNDDAKDLAETIFGYVAERKKTKSLAGRVFFTDAICDLNQENIWLPNGIITPKILGSPKPTTFQHYLVQDKDINHDPDNKHLLAHYGTPTPEETVIRGHKLYWHKQDGLDTEDFREIEEPQWESDTQHTQIKPVSADKKFSFRVYFENLEDVELGALLWVLDLPQGHHHKIGMGKSLGLGSVDIEPHLVMTNRFERYSKLFNDKDWCTGEDAEISIEKFKQDFEDYVLKHMDQKERGSAQEISQLSRIEMLLKMLEWPGPNADLTKYMTIEPNQYKGRPVLPDPLNVGPKRGVTSRMPNKDIGEIAAIPKNTDFPSSAKSAGFMWLENTAKDLKINLDGLLKKRPKYLPKKWDEIKESNLKSEVLKEIVEQLKINGIWNDPPTQKLGEMVQFFKTHIEGQG